MPIEIDPDTGFEIMVDEPPEGDFDARLDAALPLPEYGAADYVEPPAALSGAGGAPTEGFNPHGGAPPVPDAQGGAGMVGDVTDPIAPGPYRGEFISHEDATAPQGLPLEAGMPSYEAPPPERQRPQRRQQYGGVRATTKPKLPGDLRQHGGFYFQESYLQDVKEAFEAGEIDEKQRDAAIAKFEETSVGLKNQMFHNSLQGAREQSQAQAGEARTQADFIGEAADVTRDAISEEERIKSDHDEIQAEGQAKYDTEMASYRGAMEAYGKMGVDPNRHWYRSSVGGVILSSLAMALGAFGAALTKSPNFAMENVRKAINDDISAQRDAIQKAGTKIGMQKGILTDLYRQLGDMPKAEAAARADVWQRVGHQINSMRGKNASALINTRADEALKFAKRQETGAVLGMKHNAAMASEAHARMVADQRAAAAWSRANAKRKAAKEQQMAAMGIRGTMTLKSLKSNGWDYIDGLGVSTRGKLTDDVIKDFVVGQEFVSLIDKALNTDSFGPNDYYKRKQLEKSLYLVAKDEKKLGVIAGADMSLIAGYVGEPGSMNPVKRAAAQTHLRQLREQVVEGHQRKKNMLRIIPGRLVGSTNDKGVVEPEIWIGAPGTQDHLNQIPGLVTPSAASPPPRHEPVR